MDQLELVRSHRRHSCPWRVTVSRTSHSKGKPTDCIQIESLILCLCAVKLISEENIRGVISMNEDYELRYAVSNQDNWQRLGVSFLQLSTPDILHSPAQDKLERGVEFIINFQQKVSENSLESDLIPEISAISLSSFPWRIQNNANFLDHDLSLANNNNSIHSPSVYVHCKAGRTRSATLVACYLIKVQSHSMAINSLIKRR